MKLTESGMAVPSSNPGKLGNTEKKMPGAPQCLAVELQYTAGDTVSFHVYDQRDNYKLMKTVVIADMTMRATCQEQVYARVQYPTSYLYVRWWGTLHNVVVAIDLQTSDEQAVARPLYWTRRKPCAELFPRECGAGCLLSIRGDRMFQLPGTEKIISAKDFDRLLFTQTYIGWEISKLPWDVIVSPRIAEIALSTTNQAAAISDYHSQKGWSISCYKLDRWRMLVPKIFMNDVVKATNEAFSGQLVIEDFRVLALTGQYVTFVLKFVDEPNICVGAIPLLEIQQREVTGSIVCNFAPLGAWNIRDETLCAAAAGNRGDLLVKNAGHVILVTRGCARDLNICTDYYDPCFHSAQLAGETYIVTEGVHMGKMNPSDDSNATYSMTIWRYFFPEDPSELLSQSSVHFDNLHDWVPKSQRPITITRTGIREPECACSAEADCVCFKNQVNAAAAHRIGYLSLFLGDAGPLQPGKVVVTSPPQTEALKCQAAEREANKSKWFADWRTKEKHLSYNHPSLFYIDQYFREHEVSLFEEVRCAKCGGSSVVLMCSCGNVFYCSMTCASADCADHYYRPHNMMASALW